jgi:hypothetical protein
MLRYVYVLTFSTPKGTSQAAYTSMEGAQREAKRLLEGDIKDRDFHEEDRKELRRALEERDILEVMEMWKESCSFQDDITIEELELQGVENPNERLLVAAVLEGIARLLRIGQVDGFTVKWSVGSPVEQSFIVVPDTPLESIQLTFEVGDEEAT